MTLVTDFSALLQMHTSLAMDTWQDEMFDNFAGHSPYYGVPYITSEPDSPYDTTPDDLTVTVEKATGRHTSVLCAKPQLNWMKAAYPPKVNWLQYSPPSMTEERTTQ